MSRTLTCGEMVATLTPHGAGCRVRVSGPSTLWERVVPEAIAERYAAAQIGFTLVADSAHTAGLAFARKVKTPGHHAVKRVFARKAGRK